MEYNGFLYRAGKSGTDIERIAICSGRPVPIYAARIQAFMNWARAHPEKWNLTDFEGVVLALRESWPCKNSN